MKKKLLVSEALRHGAEADPRQVVENSTLPVSAGDGQVIVSVGIVEERESGVESVEESGREEKGEDSDSQTLSSSSSGAF